MKTLVLPPRATWVAAPPTSCPLPFAAPLSLRRRPKPPGQSPSRRSAAGALFLAPRPHRSSVGCGACAVHHSCNERGRVYGVAVQRRLRVLQVGQRRLLHLDRAQGGSWWWSARPRRACGLASAVWAWRVRRLRAARAAPGSEAAASTVVCLHPSGGRPARVRMGVFPQSRGRRGGDRRGSGPLGCPVGPWRLS